MQGCHPSGFPASISVHLAPLSPPGVGLVSFLDIGTGHDQPFQKPYCLTASSMTQKGHIRATSRPHCAGEGPHCAGHTGLGLLSVGCWS
jgi:hypothetical protein